MGPLPSLDSIQVACAESDTASREILGGHNSCGISLGLSNSNAIVVSCLGFGTPLPGPELSGESLISKVEVGAENGVESGSVGDFALPRELGDHDLWRAQ